MKCMIVVRTQRPRLRHQTVAAISNIQKWLMEAGHACALDVRPWSIDDEARNLASKRFYVSGAELMIGINNKVGIERPAFERMFAANAPYIGAVIPTQEPDLDAFAESVRGGQSDAEARESAGAGADWSDPRGDIVEVERVGAGFCMLRRDVMTRAFELRLATHTVMSFPGTREHSATFFDHITDEDGTRLSTEHSLCRRVRAAGYQVYAYRGPGVVFSATAEFRS